MPDCLYNSLPLIHTADRHKTMQETLYIENFLLIKKAEIEINKINVLIGPQASGKSLIAKLCYFFQGIFDHIMKGAFLKKSTAELNNIILKDFTRRFPRYTWNGGHFSIRYQNRDTQFFLQGEKNKKRETNLSVVFDEELLECYTKDLKKFLDVYSSVLSGQSLLLESVFENVLMANETKLLSSGPVFIPSARSFFSTLKNNIFNFMLSGADIDIFIQEFGALYESCKKKKEYFAESEKELNMLKDLIASVIGGSYLRDDDQDWIIQKSHKINLAHASSGQQEALPMLLVLLIYAKYHTDKDKLFFIEEPEAHLFPEAQSKVVAFLSCLYSEFQTGFFLTSHSPYILSALNNHILASEVVEAGKMVPEQFTELNGYGVPIRFSDVAAYTIDNGEVNSIRDEEYQMIGGEMLDGISDHFGQVTDTLLNLRG